jgi:hypothetical protein
MNKGKAVYKTNKYYNLILNSPGKCGYDEKGVLRIILNVEYQVGKAVDLTRPWKLITELTEVVSSEVEGKTYYEDAQGNTYVGCFWNDDDSDVAYLQVTQ